MGRAAWGLGPAAGAGHSRQHARQVLATEPAAAVGWPAGLASLPAVHITFQSDAGPRLPASAGLGDRVERGRRRRWAGSIAAGDHPAQARVEVGAGYGSGHAASAGSGRPPRSPSLASDAPASHTHPTQRPSVFRLGLPASHCFQGDGPGRGSGSPPPPLSSTATILAAETRRRRCASLRGDPLEAGLTCAAYGAYRHSPNPGFCGVSSIITRPAQVRPRLQGQAGLGARA